MAVGVARWNRHTRLDDAPRLVQLKDCSFNVIREIALEEGKRGVVAIRDVFITAFRELLAGKMLQQFSEKLYSMAVERLARGTRQGNA